MDGIASGLETGTLIIAVTYLTAKPFNIVNNIRHGGIGTGIARAKFPIFGWPTNKAVMRQRGHTVRNPRKAIAMPRKHFIRRNDVAIDIIGADINLPMGGMLDTVNNDKTIRANGADCFGNGGHIHTHAGDR